MRRHDGHGCRSEVGMRYARIIGEKGAGGRIVWLRLLGLYRPAVILGNSNTPGYLSVVMPLLHWAMPSKYHSIHKNDLARAMVAQSELALRARADRATGVTGRDATGYDEMKPFFVKRARVTSHEPGTGRIRRRHDAGRRVLPTDVGPCR